jgi:ABC-type lipoprotein export system ATPase subunit
MVTHDDEFAASASRRLVLKDGVLIADERRPRDTSVVR